MTIDINIDKHAKYFNRILGVLPSHYQSEDSNKLSIIYFALNGLSIMGKLDVLKLQERESLINQVYDIHMIQSGEGFRGSAIYDVKDSLSLYDPANLAATFFALNILFILKDGSITTKINRDAIMKYLQRCQLPNGAFCPQLDLSGVPFGDTDLRYCMIAASIRDFLQYEEGPYDIDLSLLEKYILSSVAFDGGIGGAPSQESHAGLTYCGLCTLKLINKIQGTDWSRTIDFLVHRQIGQFRGSEVDYEFNDDDDFGGFNGRLNKYGDTCYGFWTLGSLNMIIDNGDSLIDAQALMGYLSRTQNQLMGGFSKTTDEDDRSDPLHSFLGLFTLCMLNDKNEINSQLSRVCLEYLLASDVVEFMRLIKWD